MADPAMNQPEEEVDINGETFQALVADYTSEHYPTLTEEKIKEIEATTRDRNEIWSRERGKRLISSYFKQISRRREEPTKLLKELLFDDDNAAVPVQLQGCEQKEMLKAERFYGGLKFKEGSKEGFTVDIEKCGLFVHSECSFLAASPTRLVYINKGKPNQSRGILEIFCPISKWGVKIEDSFDNNYLLERSIAGFPGVSLKTTSDRYYTIQGTMAISGAGWCDLLVYQGESEDEYHLQKIQFDETFWRDSLLPSLQHFMKFAYVPEKILRRVSEGNILYTTGKYVGYNV